MCGIAGIIGCNNPYFSKDIQGLLQRRGSDQKGLYEKDLVTLIHTRLKVTDLNHGQQPMIFSEGDFEIALICNGNLYNAQELRIELKNLGHKFTSLSDTEVLLHAYVEWQEKCVERLNGTFAFAVWENHNKRLFFARDRMGVKPLFYARRGEIFIFGSEIKTLLAHPLIEPQIDIDSIAEIMLIGPGRTPGYGVIKGIEEVLPAYCGFFYQSNPNNLQLWPYWKLEDKPHTDTFDQTTEKVRELIIDSIKRQIAYDVPMGTFLSGGLDSSIISSVTNSYFRKQSIPLHTFSVDFKDNERFFQSNPFQPGNDHPFIEKMTDYLGSTHHRILLDTEKLVDALYDAVDARDLPGMADVDASLLLFCKEVKKHVTVAMSGECADELFGGYPWFRDKTIRDREGFPWSKSNEYRMSFLKPELAKAINTSYVEERYGQTVAKTNILPNISPLERRMKEMINLNLQWFMQTLLERKDRMSMYNGLEARVPFCDYRIVEYLYTIPWEMKNYKNREKGLLRLAMEDFLPDEILWRKKSPYPKTYNPSYLQTVSNRLKETIADTSAPILRIINKESLENLLKIENHAHNSVPWYGQLMTTPQTIAYFLQLNYWLEKYHIQIV
ncbi:MAG: asparagine synthase (glutamine-hydrolyzing) [Defluviitaleaceae bacterium]|nr:asparagine synthase (glutamine-hydrolyzing) [Defluviitaleaceae bacterium]